MIFSIREGQGDYIPAMTQAKRCVKDRALKNAKQKEEYVVRLALQMVRALAKHKILATQSPGKDVLAGPLKENIQATITKTK